MQAVFLTVRDGFPDTFLVFLSNSPLLFFIAAIFRQVITHGPGFFFPLFLQGGRNGRDPVLIVRVACAGKGIRLAGSQTIATGGNTGFLVFTFPFSLLTGYFFFSPVIVVFDLCQFLFSAVLHPVYVFLGVFRLQRGKFLRQPALRSHTLLGFRFRFFIGLFRIGVSADISFLGGFGGFPRFLLRLLQITVTLVLRIFQQDIISLLIMFSDSLLRIIHLADFRHIALYQILPYLSEESHSTFSLFRFLGLDLVYFFVSFGRLADQILDVGLMKQDLHVVLALLGKGIVPLGKGFIITETFPVFAVQFLHLRLFLLLAAGEVLYFTDNRFQLKAGTHHLGAAVLLDLGHFLQRDIEFVHAFLGAEQILRPLHDLVTVHHKQHDAGRKCRLPGKKRREYLLPYRRAFLPRLPQLVVFLTGTGQLIGEYRQVVTDGQKEHLRSHSQRGHLTGNLLDAVVQAVKLALCIGHVRRGDLYGFRFRLKLSQLAAQFLKLLFQRMDLGNVGALVQIGGGCLTGKAQPFQFRLQHPDGVTKLQRLTLGLVHAGRKAVLHQKFNFYRFHSSLL